MLSIYVICAIVGGGLILAAALGGLTSSVLDGIGDGGGADFDHSVDVDHSSDLSVGGDHDFDHSHGSELAKDLGHSSGMWLPFFSLRFWIYAVGGFGVFGTFLTLTGAAFEPLAMWLAIGFGFILGTAVALAMRWLKGQESDSMIREGDMLGVAGKMVVALRNGEPGKVRIQVKGETLDLLALSKSGEEIERGEEVVVVQVDDERVTVAKVSEIFENE